MERFEKNIQEKKVKTIWTVPECVWRSGILQLNKIIFWKADHENVQATLRFLNLRFKCDKVSCQRPDATNISDLKSHTCNMGYPPTTEKKKTLRRQPFDWRNVGNDEVCLFYTFTRESSVKKTNMTTINHPWRYKRASDFIKKQFPNLTCRWVRAYHKISPSSTTILHAPYTRSGYYPFSTILATLRDRPMNVSKIVFALRHSLDLSCSGYYLLEFLEAIKSEFPSLFTKIFFYVDGFEFRSGSHKQQLIIDRRLIPVTDLYQYLERYPIAYCDPQVLEIDDAVNKFLYSMYREFMTKENLPSIGRSVPNTTDFEVSVDPNEIVDTLITHKAPKPRKSQPRKSPGEVKATAKAANPSSKASKKSMTTPQCSLAKGIFDYLLTLSTLCSSTTLLFFLNLLFSPFILFFLNLLFSPFILFFLKPNLYNQEEEVYSHKRG
jgi:hypothetical protein